MTDSYILQTDLGTITVTGAALANVVVKAVKDYDGKVIISNKKGRIQSFSQLIGVNDELSEVRVKETKGELSIKIYLVLKFGTSIGYVTQSLAEKIRKGFSEITGRNPKKITIVITGMLSGDNLAKRNIEVSKTYEN